MAELTQPKYQSIRLNTQSAKAARTSMPAIPNKQFQPTHEMKMADIAARGTVNIIDAFQAAEQLAVRLELAEEDVLINKHIGEQKLKVSNNLITALPNQLLPKDIEEGFNKDGYKIGDDTITPYVVSEHLSDKAKELIQPSIDAANNTFRIDTQNKFTKELVRRSVVRLDNFTKESKANFQGQINKDIREGKLGNTIFLPNRYKAAEDSAKAYEAVLRDEMKYKSIDEPTLNLKLTQYKQDLAGIIFDRHVAQDPSGAMEQYKTGHKIENGIYVSGYEVGGVSIDPARIANLMDSHVKTANAKIEQSEYNAFRIRELSFATRQPLLALEKYGIKKITPEFVKNKLGYDIPVNIETWTGDLSKIDPDKFPHLDAAMLENIVATAVLSRETHVKLAQTRNKNRLQVELNFSLGNKLSAHSLGKKALWYNFKPKEGGWRPKPDQIDILSAKYELDSQDVETIMINAVSPYAHLAVGKGMLSPDFLTFQNSVLGYFKDSTQYDRGYGQEQEDLANPLNTAIGKSNIMLMNNDQRGALGQMVVDLEGIRTLKRNYKTIPLDELSNTYSEYSNKFISGDNRVKLQSEAWKNVQVEIANRIENMTTMPVVVALKDMGYYDWAYKVHYKIPMEEGNEASIPKRSDKARDDIIAYMRKMKIWGHRKRETFLLTANELFLASDLSKFGIDEEPTDELIEKLNPL